MSFFTGEETSEERNRREDESGRFWDRIEWERAHCPPLGDGVKDEPKPEQDEQKHEHV
jgi:hypothetical protein